jgi:hypothetical protein
MEQMEKKMNWGTLLVGIVIGLVVMWVIQAATRPAAGQLVGTDPQTVACDYLSTLVRTNPGLDQARNVVCDRGGDSGPSL